MNRKLDGKLKRIRIEATREKCVKEIRGLGLEAEEKYLVVDVVEGSLHTFLKEIKAYFFSSFQIRAKLKRKQKDLDKT